MADALVARAQKHAEWIGDDHGDRYEVAMIAGEIDQELQIVAKEILDHLRAALDYCARQVWKKFSGMPLEANIYFPIAREHAKSVHFPSLMNAKMPGVCGKSPQALVEFTSVQAFANPANAWLPELATLSNSVKHEHLSVARLPKALLHMRLNEAGVHVMTFEPGHGPKRHMPWMMLFPEPGGSPEHTVYEARFLVFAEINVELAHYFKEAIAGVTAIVARCRQLLEQA